jgi:hypothetical protein
MSFKIRAIAAFRYRSGFDCGLTHNIIVAFIAEAISMNAPDPHIRYFTSYSGLTLPLNLVGEISVEDMNDRNTFFEGHYDAQGRLTDCFKKVYGDIELEHHYHYRGDGSLASAQVSHAGDEVMELHYDADGKRLP